MRARPSADGILVAAEREFARRGYGETSLRQLMLASKVSTTAFYARFASKEAVLRELVLRLIGELDERARSELMAARSPEDGFRRGAAVLAEVLGPKRELVRLALTEGAASREVNETVARVYSSLAALLASQILRLMDRGRIESVDAEAVAWGLVGAVNIHVLRWAVWREIEVDELAKQLQATAKALTPVLVTKPGRVKQNATQKERS
ncbi:MAG: TetR/AcrR family transcriptional regulator [Polyangiaceae bacterium]